MKSKCPCRYHFYMPFLPYIPFSISEKCKSDPRVAITNLTLVLSCFLKMSEHILLLHSYKCRNLEPRARLRSPTAQRHMSSPLCTCNFGQARRLPRGRSLSLYIYAPWLFDIYWCKLPRCTKDTPQSRVLGTISLKFG